MPLVLAALLAALSFSHTTALVRLLLAVALVLGLAATVRDKGWREWIPPFAWPFVAWAAWCALSWLWSIDAPYTASELRAELFYGAVTLAASFYAAGRANARRIVLPVVAATSVVLALVALAWFILERHGSIPARTFGGPGLLTSTVLALFPVAAAAALAPNGKSRARRAGFAMAVALLATGFTALSRTLWPALAVQIVLVAALLHPPRSDVRRLAAIAGIALAFALLQTGLVQKLRFGADSPIPEASPGFEDPRPALWGRALEQIGAHPITGVGYGRGILRNDLPVRFDEAKLWHAHNLFLDTGVQLGVPGIILLGLLLGAIAMTGIRLARGADEFSRACGAALVAVVAGMVLRNLTDDVWVRQSALLFWAVVGTLTGLGLRASRR